MTINETAYQMLLSPDWTDVHTAMLLLMSQPDTEQRVYLLRLLRECATLCYEELCEDDDEESAYIKHEGWSCNMCKDNDGDITVTIMHRTNYHREFKFFIFPGEHIDLLTTECIPSSLQLTIAVCTEDAEKHIGDVTLYYEYLQNHWMNLFTFTEQNQLITLP